MMVILAVREWRNRVEGRPGEAPPRRPEGALAEERRKRLDEEIGILDGTTAAPLPGVGEYF